MAQRSYSSHTLQILLVDDNPADTELTRQCFRESRIPNEVHSVSNFEATLAFLKREGEFSKSLRPDLVLLDLNMPGVDGREILAAIKGNPKLLTIPVVILTTSDADYDVEGAYRLHANSYLRKPADLDEFVELADAVCAYWGRYVIAPPGE